MPTGELPPTALERLAEVGVWMDVNGEAIHDTTPQSPYVSVLKRRAILIREVNF
jgi:alpha-L-fucosidase